ncbi:MAG: hypothetical protein Q8O88_05110 [bacterium]|nr:hypothetical protein [bacterium]
MDHNIQDIFMRIQEKKAEMKDLKSVCKQIQDNSGEYMEIEENLKTLREKRKSVLGTILSQCSGEVTKIEDLKIDIESDQEMLNDMAMLSYTKGETIEIKDKYDNEYEPIFSVKFKKRN